MQIYADAVSMRLKCQSNVRDMGQESSVLLQFFAWCVISANGLGCARGAQGFQGPLSGTYRHIFWYALLSRLLIVSLVSIISFLASESHTVYNDSCKIFSMYT